MKIVVFFLTMLAFAAAEIKIIQLPGTHGPSHHLRRDLKKKVGIGNASAKPTGKDLGQLTLDHWDWNICGGDGDGGDVFAFSLDECPEQEDVPEKWTFLAGDARDPPASTRSCTVSKKKFLLIPIVNTICFKGDVDCPEEGSCLPTVVEHCSEASEDMQATKATVDGKDAKVVRLLGKVEEYHSTCPQDTLSVTGGFNVIGDPAATEGLWVVIPPLSKGEHTLEFAGSNGDDFSLEFTLTLDAE